MANKLNVNDGVVYVSSKEEGFKKASELAKQLGSQAECGFAVTAYQYSAACYVHVAYSNGVWVNCLGCDCLDKAMLNAFTNYLVKRAQEADLDLGYNNN